MGDLISPLLLADFVYPRGHPLAGRGGVVFGFAIRHSAGVFLFDTGIGRGHRWIDENYRPHVRAIDEALAEHGLRAREVVAIANSHLHFDHCGQNRRFPSVPIWVQRAEREAARGEGYTIVEWVEFPGVRYTVIEGEAEPLPGIRVVPTPGHTPGHQSALVDTPGGIVALAGHVEGIAARLRALGAARVLPAHQEAA